MTTKTLQQQATDFFLSNQDQMNVKLELIAVQLDMSTATVCNGRIEAKRILRLEQIEAEQKALEAEKKFIEERNHKLLNSVFSADNEVTPTLPTQNTVQDAMKALKAMLPDEATVQIAY
ncbi:hypothetical protein ACNO7T_15715 [Vibrio campbellii]